MNVMTLQLNSTQKQLAEAKSVILLKDLSLAAQNKSTETCNNNLQGSLRLNGKN